MNNVKLKTPKTDEETRIEHPSLVKYVINLFCSLMLTNIVIGLLIMFATSTTNKSFLLFGSLIFVIFFVIRYRKNRKIMQGETSENDPL